MWQTINMVVTRLHNVSGDCLKRGRVSLKVVNFVLSVCVCVTACPVFIIAAHLGKKVIIYH